MDSWLEVEAAILGSYEVEWEEEDDESWLDRPWPETEEPEWCGRSCCREIIMAAQRVVRLPQGECEVHFFGHYCAPTSQKHSRCLPWSFKQLFRKGFVNTSKQNLSKKVNSELLLLFLLRYKQFT